MAIKKAELLAGLNAAKAAAGGKPVPQIDALIVQLTATKGGQLWQKATAIKDDGCYIVVNGKAFVTPLTKKNGKGITGYCTVFYATDQRSNNAIARGKHSLQVA